MGCQVLGKNWKATQTTNPNTQASIFDSQHSKPQLKNLYEIGSVADFTC